MSAAGMMFLLGSFASFLAERMFEANAVVRWPLHGLAALLVIAGLSTTVKNLGRHPRAARLGLGFFLIALTSGLFYLLSLPDTVAALGLTGEGAERFRVVMQVAVPLVWAIGTFPALAIDRTLAASPHSVHPLRLRAALDGGLTLAFGLGMLFPLNYLATELNQRYDFGFFKTTAVGSTTRATVGELTEPLKVVLFFPPSSEVLREVRPYFDDLADDAAMVSVEVADQTMEPELAKKWKVRDNGTIVFVKGEGDDERTESVKLSDKLDTARKDLRKLDSKVQTALLKLARDKRTAYFTVGHDELYWKNAPNPLDNVDVLKKGIEGLNFKVKELGVDDGLASAVPDDAAVVFVAGPKRPFLPEEITALREYRDRGGALFILLEAGETPDPALAALAGVAYAPAHVLSDKAYVRVTGGPTDRAYVGTSKFSSHESMTTLTKNASALTLITPMAGSLTELAEHAGKVTMTVKGSPEWWADLDGDYEFDKDVEKRGGIDIAAVATGPAEGGREWRAAVVADASWASNLVLAQSQGNQVYFVETLGWLTQDPALSGETESEEDVKIQHTKEGEAVWFYGTSVLVPIGVFMAGWLRTRSRRRRGAA